jgi:hypothetical protein
MSQSRSITWPIVAQYDDYPRSISQGSTVERQQSETGDDSRTRPRKSGRSAPAPGSSKSRLTLTVDHLLGPCPREASGTTALARRTPFRRTIGTACQTSPTDAAVPIGKRDRVGRGFGA